MEGINFRERNAGPQIDQNMRDEGKCVCVCIQHICYAIQAMNTAFEYFSSSC